MSEATTETTSPTNTLTIPNWRLADLLTLLGRFELSPYNSAVRMSLAKKVRDDLVEYQEGEQHIREQFVPKDENGKPIWARGTLVDGEVQPDPEGEEIEGYWIAKQEDVIAMNTALNELASDMWEFESKNPRSFSIIRGFFDPANQTDLTFGGDEASLLWDLQVHLCLVEDIEL